MDLCFVKTKSALDSLLARPGLDPKSVRFAGLEWEVLEEIRRRGLPALSVDGLFDEAADVALHEVAKRVSSGWYVGPDGRDFTLFRGVSIGRMYDSLLCYMEIMPFYRLLETARRAVRAERPRTVWCESGSSFRILRGLELLRDDPAHPFELRILEERDLSVESDLREVLGPASAWKPGRRTAFSALRDALFFRFYRAAAPLMKRLRGRADLPRRILVSYHLTMSDVLEELMRPPWRDRIDVVLLERPGPKLLWKCLWNGYDMIRPEVHASVPDLDLRLSPEEEDELTRLRAAWDRAKGSAWWKNRLALEGIVPSAYLENAIERIVMAELEKSARWISFLNGFADEKKVDFVLVSVDSMPRQNSVLSVAKNRGIPSVMMLHGMPSAYSGKEAVHADYLALGGEEIRRDFIGLGRTPESILTDRGCFFDHYAGARKPAPGDPRRVLVLTYPIIQTSALVAPDEGERFLFTVLDILSGFEGVSGKLRPHPSESRDFYGKLIEKYPNFTIDGARDVDDSIAGCGLVIGPASTALIQAILLGRPAICANFSRFEFARPFVEGSGLPVARTPEQLRALVRRALSEEGLPGDPGWMEKFTGKLDGQGTRRLLSTLDRGSGG